MHVTIVGNVCIDTNMSEHVSYTAAGGPAIFIHKIFSQLRDMRMTIVSPFGKDFLSFSSDLPLFSKIPTHEKTLVYENKTKENVRTQKAYNRQYAKPLRYTKELEDSVARTDILFFTPLLPNLTKNYVQTLVNKTKKHALKVLLPQGYYRAFTKNNTVTKRDFREAKDILPLMDIVVVSEQDGENMCITAKEWSRKYEVISIVTLGERGAIAFQGNEEILLSTDPVLEKDIVDSVGSGDIFSACFAYAYKKTGSIEKAGAFANKIARACLFFPADRIQLDPLLLI